MTFMTRQNKISLCDMPFPNENGPLTIYDDDSNYTNASKKTDEENFGIQIIS